MPPVLATRGGLKGLIGPLRSSVDQPTDQTEEATGLSSLGPAFGPALWPFGPVCSIRPARTPVLKSLATFSKTIGPPPRDSQLLRVLTLWVQNVSLRSTKSHQLCRKGDPHPGGAATFVGTTSAARHRPVHCPSWSCTRPLYMVNSAKVSLLLGFCTRGGSFTPFLTKDLEVC